MPSGLGEVLVAAPFAEANATVGGHCSAAPEAHALT